MLQLVTLAPRICAELFPPSVYICLRRILAFRAPQYLFPSMHVWGGVHAETIPSEQEKFHCRSPYLEPN